MTGVLFDWDGVVINCHDALQAAGEILAGIALTGIGPWFQEIAAAEDVVRGKPEPDVFLKAAATIGDGSRACVLIEDAHVSVQATRAAACAAAAVGVTHPAESFAGQADLMVRSLEHVTVEQLPALFPAPAR